MSPVRLHPYNLRSTNDNLFRGKKKRSKKSKKSNKKKRSKKSKK